ncbi:MAG: cupin domain-containing protein [Verrucomicrobiales bacterium]|nr:cupin domain-containing protein [Verrucomicrobiales bacterium]
MPPFAVAQLDQLPGIPCPCGTARRAFGDQPHSPASLHLVEIKADAERHFHRRTTEIYLVLEGTGFLEIDQDRVPVRPLTAVMIPAGCRHRAVGNLRLVNIVIPRFDASDEFID